MSTLAVRIERKVYPGAARPALEGLHLELALGEFVAVVGPSGAGKSTLLNVVGGLDPGFTGSVTLNGRSRNVQGDAGFRVGMMFQSPRLMPWLTVLENLQLVLGDDTAATAYAREILSEVGLREWEGAFPNQLSGGMQRRVALARAFSVRPALLLLDEPFVSLDAPTAARLRANLLDLWSEHGPTVLYVTHDLREALAMADRAVFLSGSPGRAVLEVHVALPRPRDPDGTAVGELQAKLLAEHPELLSGLTRYDEAGAGAP